MIFISITNKKNTKVVTVSFLLPESLFICWSQNDVKAQIWPYHIVMNTQTPCPQCPALSTSPSSPSAVLCPVHCTDCNGLLSVPFGHCSLTATQAFPVPSTRSALHVSGGCFLAIVEETIKWPSSSSPKWCPSFACWPSSGVYHS